jgi:hypothetical protein
MNHSIAKKNPLTGHAVVQDLSFMYLYPAEYTQLQVSSCDVLFRCWMGDLHEQGNVA